MISAGRYIVITERELEDIDAARLSPNLRRLVNQIGPLEALRLTCRYGGMRIYVPGSKAGKTLRRVLTPESVAKLTQDAAHVEIDVPQPDSMLAQIRNTRIRALHAAGISLNDLASEFNLSRRQIVNICQGDPAQ